jgi:hypothetical protein
VISRVKQLHVWNAAKPFVSRKVLASGRGYGPSLPGRKSNWIACPAIEPPHLWLMWMTHPSTRDQDYHLVLDILYGSRQFDASVTLYFIK